MALRLGVGKNQPAVTSRRRVYRRKALVVADTPAQLLEHIGYAQYQKNLEAGGCANMAELQFVTLEVLLQCGVKPVHAAHMFALLKEALGLPPTTQSPESTEIEPVRVYICAAAPPTVNIIDVPAMMCDMELMFDAVWVDPRLRQGETVRPGDPVIAPYSWRPIFGCAGMHKMRFEALRSVYLEPDVGLVRTQYVPSTRNHP